MKAMKSTKTMRAVKAMKSMKRATLAKAAKAMKAMKAMKASKSIKKSTYIKAGKVEKRKCGSSGLTISSLSLGCWQFGQKGADDYWGLEFTQDLAGQLVSHAIGNGMMYMDTA